MKNELKMLIGVVAFLFSSQSFAVPITGEIVFVGAGTYYNAYDGGSAIDGIDIIDAAPDGTTSAGWGTAGTVSVGFGTSGDFDTLFNIGDTGLMNDIDFSQSSIANLWSIGSISFSLDTYTHGAIVDSNGFSRGYEVMGWGTVTDSDGVYADEYSMFTWNQSSSRSIFSFDATTAPEPAAVALLGLGLLALGGLKASHRRRRQL